MMTHSEVLAATSECGTWIIYVSKLLNLEHLEVENDQQRHAHLQKPLSTSISRSGRFDGEEYMDGPEQSSYGQLVSTIDTDHVKSKNQDKEGIPGYQKPLILLNSHRV